MTSNHHIKKQAGQIFRGLMGLGWLLSAGCATTHHSLQPLPDMQNEQERIEYYQTHRIQKADGDKVTVDNQVYAANDPTNGLGYLNQSGRVNQYTLASSVERLDTKAWFIAPAATLVGTAVGGFLGIISQLSPNAGQNNPGNFAAVGGAGLIIGTVTAIILTREMPDIVNRKTQRRVQKYNRRLSHDLDLSVVPYDRGEGVGMKLAF